MIPYINQYIIPLPDGNVEHLSVRDKKNKFDKISKIFDINTLNDLERAVDNKDFDIIMEIINDCVIKINNE